MNSLKINQKNVDLGKLYIVFSLESGTDSYDLFEKEVEKLRIRKTVHCVSTLEWHILN